MPLVHCAFEGCGWVSESLPCHRNALHEESEIRSVHQGEWSTTPCRQKLSEEVYGCCGSGSCLRHHIVAHHGDVIAKMCGFDAPRVDSYDYNCEAVAWREQQKMPAVGISIDRRTFKHASVALQESKVASLICACCQCQFTCLDGTYGEIGRIDTHWYFNSISEKSFKRNWCAAEYMDRYGNTPAMENHPALLPDVWNFKRLLRCSRVSEQVILCCPEDIRCDSTHDARELYPC